MIPKNIEDRIDLMMLQLIHRYTEWILSKIVERHPETWTFSAKLNGEWATWFGALEYRLNEKARGNGLETLDS